MIGDSASNADALLALLVAGAAGAALGALAALVRWSFLPVFDPNSGAEVIELHPEDRP